MTQPDGDRFTVEELADRTRAWLEAHGLDAHYYRRVQDAPSERTIRYYRSLGLLDEPIKEGKRRLYTRRHMLQLLAIKALQTRGLSHDRIQTELYARSDAELEAVVSAALPRRADDPPPSVALREFALAPGLRLVVAEAELGSRAIGEREALVARFEAALDALAGAPRGAGTAGDNGKEEA